MSSATKGKDFEERAWGLHWEGEGEQGEDGVEQISLCAFLSGGVVFGIDTRRIREVLDVQAIQPVPKAPTFVAGIVSYRGEMLTAVELASLLGTTCGGEESCMLVLEDDEVAERFGLVVDSVAGVMTVSKDAREENPSTLGVRNRWLFDGVYKMQTGLMVQLDPEKLRPSRLAETRLFR